MNIIIVGCGKVGYTIAEELVGEGKNIVVIDKKRESLKKIEDDKILDVMTIQGNGLVRDTLIAASVKTAELIICVTNSDETNVLCCVTAKELGVKNAVARVRDPEYADELKRLRKGLKLDMIINPEELAALEISRLLRYPMESDDIDTFANGKVEMVSYRVTEGSALDGRLLSKAYDKSKIPVLIAAIQRGEKTIIPHGDAVLFNGDLIRVMGRSANVDNFFRHIGAKMDKVKDAMIIGGGKVTFYLVDQLIKYNMKVKIIEIDPEKRDRLDEAFPGCTIILGDGTDEALLLEEKMADSGSVVCLTDRDEENVVVGMYAKQCGVPKTVVKINHINRNLVKNVGLGAIVCPKSSSALQILRYVRGLKNSADKNEILTLYKIVDTEDESVEVLEFDVKEKSRCTDKRIQSLPLKKDVLIGCIVRGDNIFIADGESEIKLGDTVTVIAKNLNMNQLDDILHDNNLINNFFGGDKK